MTQPQPLSRRQRAVSIRWLDSDHQLDVVPGDMTLGTDTDPTGSDGIELLGGLRYDPDGAVG